MSLFIFRLAKVLPKYNLFLKTHRTSCRYTYSWVNETCEGTVHGCEHLICPI